MSGSGQGNACGYVQVVTGGVQSVRPCDSLARSRANATHACMNFHRLRHCRGDASSCGAARLLLAVFGVAVTPLTHLARALPRGCAYSCHAKIIVCSAKVRGCVWYTWSDASACLEQPLMPCVLSFPCLLLLPWCFHTSGTCSLWACVRCDGIRLRRTPFMTRAMESAGQSKQYFALRRAAVMLGVVTVWS